MAKNPIYKACRRLINLLLVLLVSTAGNGLAAASDDPVKAIVDKNAPALIATFKQFHQNPELGFQEFETAATITAHLKKLGYPIVTGVGGTGVVAILENGPGPVNGFSKRRKAA